MSFCKSEQFVIFFTKPLNVYVPFHHSVMLICGYLLLFKVIHYLICDPLYQLSMYDTTIISKKKKKKKCTIQLNHFKSHLFWQKFNIGWARSIYQYARVNIFFRIQIVGTWELVIWIFLLKILRGINQLHGFLTV